MVPWIAAGLAIGFGLPFLVGGRDFCLDDAWIHLAYALSLKRGEGLSYNPGDFETGSSSPLWAVLLALWPWAGDPVLAVKLLGLLLHGLGAALAALLALRLARIGEVEPQRGRAAAAGLVAGALAAGHPALLQAATSGMEVSLTAALLLALALFALQDRAAPAFAAALCAVWARPESLFFAFALGGAQFARSRRLQSMAAPAGAALGLLSWIAYCLAVSGHPWPNTKYAKAVGLDLGGLSYLAARVLPGEPWLLGLGGLVLAGAALLRGPTAQRGTLLALLGAWLATLLATAASRPFSPGVLFYASRYFAIVAPVPAIAVGLGAARLPRAAGALLLAPVLLVNVQLARDTHVRQRAQEADVRLLHTEPARFVAQTLPSDAVVVVEGAGAARFFTPRTMTIVDMLGLNDRALAHARSDRERLCALLARRPTHLLVPDQFLGITVPLEVAPLRSFVDPSYAMAIVPRPRRVELFAIRGVRPRFAGACARPARPG